MLDKLFSSVLGETMTAGAFFLCLAVSVVLGVAMAAVCAFRRNSSRSFVLTMAMLPALIQVVIMLVNGNLGAGVAVMGAFSLVRFRSVPGTALEISCVFLAVVVGLATGMGYIGVAIITALVVGLLALLLVLLKAGGDAMGDPAEKELKVLIPEDLDYSGIFEDLFDRYTVKANLVQVKTINLGSLYRLTYRLRLKDPKEEKELLDAIRCRNGNLEIVCSRVERLHQEHL